MENTDYENEELSEPATDEIEATTEPIDDEHLTFADIVSDSELLTSISGLGFEKPSPIQRRTIPLALSGKDIIIQARTGSGKTYAFSIPLVGRLKEAERQHGKLQNLFGLIIVPTRELAIQVRDAIVSLVPEYNPVCIIGGANMDAQINDLRQDPRIVVGTPGRILDLLRQRALKLNRCQYFVLDEADEILSTGFLEDVRAILSRLPDKRQGIFSSATITPRVDMLANSFLTKPEQVIVDVAEKDLPAVEHYYCDVPGDLMSKPNILGDFIETWRPKSAIIFCNTKSDTQLVEVLLRRRGFDARRLNSDLTQGQRNKVMRKIKSGELQFLVATDIAARGIDIAQLDMVVNYAIHEQPETYIHRSGRTGRAGRAGRALSLVGPRDFGSFHFIRKVVERDFRQVQPPSDEDVANARLAHVYEILRSIPEQLAPREQLVGEKFIRELAPGIEEIPEEFQLMVSKLIRHIMEHHVRQEAKSLDEELVDTAAAEPTEESAGSERRGRGRREESRDRDDRRGRRSEVRDDERRADDDEHTGRDSRRRDDDRHRGDRRGEDRRSNDRRGDDRRRESRGEQREESHGREEPRGRDDRDNRRERRDESDSRSNQERGRQPREETARRDRDERPRQDHLSGTVRLYIGQGRAHGMTGELFLDLANEFAGAPREELKHLTVRDKYGFVDVPAKLAPSLIENLNGIEYNGHDLPVEFATSLPSEERQERRPRSDWSNDDRRRDHGNRNGRDRRGDRGGYRGNDRRRNADY